MKLGISESPPFVFPCGAVAECLRSDSPVHNPRTQVDLRNIDLFGTNPISVANRAAADPATTVAVVGLRHQSVMSERRAADSQNANAPNE